MAGTGEPADADIVAAVAAYCCRAGAGNADVVSPVLACAQVVVAEVSEADVVVAQIATLHIKDPALPKPLLSMPRLPLQPKVQSHRAILLRMSTLEASVGVTRSNASQAVRTRVMQVFHVSHTSTPSAHRH